MIISRKKVPPVFSMRHFAPALTSPTWAATSRRRVVTKDITCRFPPCRDVFMPPLAGGGNTPRRRAVDRRPMIIFVIDENFIYALRARSRAPFIIFQVMQTHFSPKRRDFTIPATHSMALCRHASGGDDASRRRIVGEAARIDAGAEMPPTF